MLTKRQWEKVGLILSWIASWTCVIGYAVYKPAGPFYIIGMLLAVSLLIIIPLELNDIRHEEDAEWWREHYEDY